MQDIVTNNINNFFNSIYTTIKNFLPWDYHIRIILFLIALVLVLGIQKIYFNIKDSNNEKKAQMS